VLTDKLSDDGFARREGASWVVYNDPAFLSLLHLSSPHFPFSTFHIYRLSLLCTAFVPHLARYGLRCQLCTTRKSRYSRTHEHLPQALPSNPRPSSTINLAIDKHTSRRYTATQSLILNLAALLRLKVASSSLSMYVSLLFSYTPYRLYIS
jgi:hypothetical protein